MSNSVWNEVKHKFLYGNNVIYKLIAVNVILFLGLAIPLVFLQLFKINWFGYVEEWLYLPNKLGLFITRPWSIISYMFLHSFGDLFHIIMNMLVMYWFGSIFQEYVGNRKTLALYFLGGIGGGLLYMTTEFIPIFEGTEMHLVGASASVLALLVASATLLPDHTIRLLLFGSVKLKWIALFLVAIDLISMTGENAGGSFAHLGGAAIGYFYVKQLQQGKDWGEWIVKILDSIAALFTSKPKSNFKVHRNDKPSSSKSSTFAKGSVTQEQIDKILDKVLKMGYDSLSDAEKNILFKSRED